MTSPYPQQPLSWQKRVATFSERALPLVLLALFFTTPFQKVAASIALSFAILFFASHRILTRRTLEPGRMRRYYLILLSFAFSMVLSLLNTQDIHSGTHLLRTTLWKLFIVAVIFESVREGDRARQLLWVYSAGCLLLALIAVYQGLVLDVWRPPTMWIAVHAGNLFMFGLIAMLSLLLHERGTGRRAILLAMVLTTTGALYLNGTRGVWVAYAFLLLLVPLLMPRASVRKKVAIYGLLVVALAGLSQTPFVREKFREARSNIESYRRSDARTSLGYRFDMWKASIVLFTEHPIIGAGTGDWQYDVRRLISEGRAPDSIEKYNQPHNILLVTLSTQGAVGIIVMMAFLAAPVILTGGGVGGDGELGRTLAVLATAGFVVSGMSDTLTHIRGVFTSYLMLIGVAFVLAGVPRPSKGAGTP